MSPSETVSSRGNRVVKRWNVRSPHLHFNQQKRELGRTTNIHTLQETNISHPKALLKIMFLFQRWDIFVPWGVWLFRGSKNNNNNMFRSGLLMCWWLDASIFWGFGVGYHGIFTFFFRNKKTKGEKIKTSTKAHQLLGEYPFEVKLAFSHCLWELPQEHWRIWYHLLINFWVGGLK